MTDKQAAARDWLQRNQWRKDEIRAMRAKLEAMRESVAKVVAVPNDVKVQTQPGNRSEKAICEIVDFEKEIDDRARYFQELDRMTLVTIGKLNNAQYVYLLTSRYLLEKTWKEIAGELHYTENYCYELHLKALDNIYSYIDFSIK